MIIAHRPQLASAEHIEFRSLIKRQPGWYLTLTNYQRDLFHQEQGKELAEYLMAVLPPETLAVMLHHFVSRKNWVWVTCTECSNTQEFPPPGPKKWLCNECIAKPPSPKKGE